MRSRTGPVILAMSILAAVAACDSSPPDRSAPPPTTQVSGHPAEHQAGHQEEHEVEAAKSPTALAGQLQQYYAQHTLLAMRQMRSVLTATPAYRQAADKELEEYSEELAQIVAAKFGDAQGERFEQLWKQGIAHFSAYAEAVAGNDAAARQQARSDLLADADAYGHWLAGASGGRVQASGAAAAMRTHAEQLMEQADAYAAHDYDRAYRVERQGYEHMFAAGTDLARASLAPKAAATLDMPVEKLRAAFAMLLGEHMQLIIDTQRATFDGSPQFKAAAAQVNANSAALTKGMGAIAGPKKADQHLVDQINAYAAKRYDEAQEMELDGYGQMLGLAGTILGAIQRTLQPQLPVGGSQTGGGGTAHWRR